MDKDKVNKAIGELIDKIEPKQLNGVDTERDKKGRFLPGNQAGKLPREKIYSTEELTQAIREVEAEDKIDILKHYIRRSLIDDRVLIDLIGKHVPKITINEIKGTGLPFNLFVTQFVEEKTKEKAKEEEKELNMKPLQTKD